jgi:CRP/FNR family transcriptional regulator
MSAALQYSVTMRGSPYGFSSIENCQTCTWRQDGFFCQLPRETLAAFDAMTFTNVYPEGAILFSEGQAPRGVFMLCHGTVKLSISSGEGKTLITHVAEQGEILGISACISGATHNIAAETLEPSQVNFVRREDFLRCVAAYPAASSNALRQLSLECDAGSDHIRALGLSRSAAEKLAHLLLSWCLQHGTITENGTRVQVLMTHDDISQLIGTSRETVTRLLRDFRDQRIVSIKGSNLIVHNKAALEALVLL